MHTAKPIDRYIPYFIISFFAVLVAAMAIFIWLAIRNYPGEVREDAYREGLKYNQLLARAQAQEKLGWQGELNFSMHGRKIEITFKLSDKNGDPIRNASVNAWFIRPTHAGHDQEIPLKPDGKGSYSGKTSLAWQGDWEVHISATKGGYNYQQVKSINLQ